MNATRTDVAGRPGQPAALTVLVTRPREDAADLAAALADRGVATIIEPMLSVRFETDAAPELNGVQALLFTSANGVRAFARACARRDLRVLAVGDATARTARAEGFGAVESAGGDVETLARLVIARLDPLAGALCHAAGSETAGDLAGRLAAAGFAVRRAVLYRAVPASRLGAPVLAALRAGGIDAVLFFSPRTAATFVSLARAPTGADDAGANDAGPADLPTAGMVAICLSPAVADAARGLPWRSVRIADAPTQAALLAAVDDMLSSAG